MCAFFRKNRPLLICFSLIALVVVLLVTSVYFYRKYRRLNTGAPAVSQKETEALVAQVGKLIILPSDETPTIATVSDPDKLKNQAFFIDAKVGDKVLIYTNAKRAILYDPKAKKIVNIAPINIGVGAGGTTSTPSASPQF